MCLSTVHSDSFDTLFVCVTLLELLILESPKLKLPLISSIREFLAVV